MSTTHKRNSLGLHPRKHYRAQLAFREAWGTRAEANRLRAIRRLRQTRHNGRRVYVLRCCGKSGKGPHEHNVPRAALWMVLSLRRFKCPFHNTEGI